jgi:hypothetical protein
MSSHLLIEQSIRRSLPRRLVLWPVAIFPLSGFIAWAINTGGEALRWLGLAGLTSAMLLPLIVSLEACMIAMMLFEPLRGFLRRAQYLFLPYTQSDPIHTLTPVVTIVALAMLLRRQRLEIFRASPLAVPVSILGLIYLLQIFNPLQGGLSVGLSGALFMLVPVAWFYFGQTVEASFVATVYKILVVVGILTSLYGLYQLAYGFPSFEQYWIENTDFFNSIQVGNVKRALATFSSAEEWGRYIELAAIVAFGFVAGAKNKLSSAAWLFSGVALSAMLLLTGQRTAMFGMILGVLIFLLIGARSGRAVFARLMLVLIPAVLVAVFVKAPTNDDMLSHGEDDRMGAVLSHTARGTLRPTEEGSLQERLTNWSFLATDLVPYRPFGIGLGGTSVGAWRFNSELDLPPIDSYFISTVITCGLPTALLFMWILFRATRMSWRRYRESMNRDQARLWRITVSLMPVLILNSFFGNTFTLYSVAPVGWLLVGFISAQQNREQFEV